MARRNVFTPSLADITQDIAGEVPLGLLNSWLYSERDEKSHQKFLEPYIVSGVVASTDSSGLSRLSQDKTLFEVIKLISHPKQLVYSFGATIGGTPVGIWAADNTEMFYPDNIKLEQIIYQMSHVFRLLQTNDLKIGLAIHKGKFIHLGGGLYGRDADYVEDLAESYSDGGQMLITSSVLSEIPDELKSNAKLKEGALGSFDFDYSNVEKFTNSTIKNFYPTPYATDFYKDLVDSDLKNSDGAKALEDKYLKNKIVVLVRVFHKEQKLLLNQLVEWIEANSLIEQTRTKHNIFKIKSNGNLGIFVSDDADSAIGFAIELKQALAKTKYTFNIGLCKGQVLIGSIEQDIWDIAGEPVNIASKIAEDSLSRNKILIEESIEMAEGESFKFEISHVEIGGKTL